MNLPTQVFVIISASRAETFDVRAELLEDGFGETPFYQCIVAEIQGDNSSEGTNHHHTSSQSNAACPFILVHHHFLQHELTHGQITDRLTRFCVMLLARVDGQVAAFWAHF